MRRLTLSVMLFASACGSSGSEDATEKSGDAEAQQSLQLTALEQRAKTQLEGKVRKEREFGALQSRVKEAMAAYLFDPASAQYRELRSGRGGAICGKLNGKNRFGAYVGFKDFVVSRDNKTVYVSDYNDGLSSQMYGSFAEAYLNACASKKEQDEHARVDAELNPPPAPYVPSPTEEAETDFTAAEEGWSETDANEAIDE